MRREPLVIVVGPCGSGKSTLVELLRKSGIRAREVGQEHTDMPYYWQRPGPGFLVYLELALEGVRRRKSAPAWTVDRHHQQLGRLWYARQRADLTLSTDDMTAHQVFEAVTEALPAADSPLPVLTVRGDFETIQDAVNAAADGQTIVILEGTYRETVHMASRTLTLRSSQPGAEDVVTATVIDGGGRGCTLHISGGRVSVIGLTITGGHGRVQRAGVMGGGITISGGAEVFLSGSVVTGNTSDGDGGGILVRDAVPVIQGNLITHNRAAGEGGGLALIRDAPSALETPRLDLPEHVTMTDVGDVGVGGGELSEDIRGEGEQPVVQAIAIPPVAVIAGNRLKANRAVGAGGAIYVGGVSPRVESNTMDDNRADRGGGIYVDDNSRPALTGNTIHGNDARLEGGGVSAGWGSSPSLDGNVITDNSAALGGGVFVWERASPRLVRNRVTRNRAPGGPDLALADRSHPELVDNTAPGGEVGRK